MDTIVIILLIILILAVIFFGMTSLRSDSNKVSGAATSFPIQYSGGGCGR
ncbi:MAG: hypothetical protein AABW90_00405 [Nanoarchaeota archaeon]